MRIQKNRSLEQIMYDHNHESLTQQDGKNYRKHEKILKKIFITNFVSIILIRLIAFHVELLIETPKLGVILTSSFIFEASYTIMSDFILVGLFLWLYRTMKKFHNYEFKKHRKHLLWYISGTQIIVWVYVLGYPSYSFVVKVWG